MSRTSFAAAAEIGCSAASPARAPAAPAVDAGVEDLIKNYRRALRRADARAVDLQARAQAAEARAVAAERRAAAAELRAAEAEAREADAPPAAPTQEVPRATAPAPPAPRPRTPDTPESDDGVAAALRDEVSNLDAEIDVLRGALRAAGDRVTAASLEERAREAAAKLALNHAEVVSDALLHAQLGVGSGAAGLSFEAEVEAVELGVALVASRLAAMPPPDVAAVKPPAILYPAMGTSPPPPAASVDSR